MKISLCACLWIGAFLAGGAQAQTFVQWNSGPGANFHYYGLTLARTSWSTAESQAVLLGGHLASVTSADEQTFLVQNFLSDGSATAVLPLWIGLTDAGNGLGSNRYTNWTDGEPLTYTNWNDASEPNNLGGNEDYVALNWHFSFGSSQVKGTWNDLPLNGSTEDYGGNNARALGPYFGIIEIAPSGVVPEPAPAGILTVFVVAFGLWIWRRHAGGRFFHPRAAVALPPAVSPRS